MRPVLTGGFLFGGLTMGKSGLKTNRSLNYKIALTGIFGALSVVLSVTPLGYISIGPLAITVMHIPVILVTIFGGLVPGLGVGLIFGVTSLVRTVTIGSSGVGAFFIDPRISIIPRLLIPVFTWGWIKIFGMIPKMPKVVTGTLAAAVGTFTNTFFVMGSLYIFYGRDLITGMAEKLSDNGFIADALSGINGFWAILFTTLITNGFFEIAGACIITFAVLGSVYLVKNKRSKLSKLEEDDGGSCVVQESGTEENKSI